jgi:two-component system LytT family response regulator
MPNFKVLIVDDERLSRRRVRRLLSLEPDCEVAAECSSGAEAVAALSQTRPDIVFLDVQMPEMDGFEVARAMDGANPLVIFTSAYDEYALRAFEVQAFDYLLKPFDGRRFRESLQRARTRVERDRSGHRDPRPVEPPAPVQSPRIAPDRIAVRNNGRVVFLKLADIDWIEAADNYVCLHAGRDTHLVRETMNELEARLDPAQFLRVHRSSIVNLDRIRELQPWFRGEYRIVLRDGTQLTLTRNHREKLEARLLLGV